MANTAPARNIATAARNVQRKRARAYPNGWSGVGSRSARWIDTYRNTWLVVSATECAVSASIAADPLSRPAANLASVTITFDPSATRTVLRLSPALARACSTLRRLVHALGDRSSAAMLRRYPLAPRLTRRAAGGVASPPD